MPRTARIRDSEVRAVPGFEKTTICIEQLQPSADTVL
jgi:hypothetical protein